MLEEIAIAIKAKISFEKSESDFWDALPPHVHKGIMESKEQVENGNYKVHEEVMNAYKMHFK